MVEWMPENIKEQQENQESFAPLKFVDKLVSVFSVTRRSRSDSRQLLTYSLTHSLSER